MSNNMQRGSVSPMNTDGISLDALLKADVLVRTDTSSNLHNFWASAARQVDSKVRDIMEVSFGSPRLLNHVSLAVSRFPVSMSIEWFDDEAGGWIPLTYARDPQPVEAPIRTPRPREAIRLTIADSSPSVVRDLPNAHPLHSGPSHWARESWKAAPVLTSKVRLVFVRNGAGLPPVNPNGRPLPYSIAVRDLTFGYRVLSRYDMPKADAGVWAASGDILGSRVGYSTYDQPSARAIDGSRETYWRSEPQPFSFAVVNMFLDMRSAAGEAQVVDKFWIDPITPGVLCNVYYSNDTDHEFFRGLSLPVDPDHEIRYGAPRLLTVGGEATPLALDISPDGERCGTYISQTFTRIAYDKAWWLGIDAQTLAPATDLTEHPIISMGSTRVVQAGGQIQVITQNGEVAALTLDPDLHLMRTRFAVTISYRPPTETTPKARIRIGYRILGYQPEIVEHDLLAPLLSSTAPIGVGLHPSAAPSTEAAAMSLRGLVVKTEALTAEAEEWFFAEGENFVSDPIALYDDRGTHFNAVLRVHPMFATETNLFGVVGGANDPFEQMTWTPIAGDYVLRQGYLHLPPTKATFWKFEMTGLLPEVYENFLTMDRDVRVFPQEVVEAYESAAGAPDENSSPPGVDTTAAMNPVVAYADVLDAIDRSQAGINFQQDPEATQVLVVRDPVQAQRVATSGWVWSYQPWHSGSRAPRFAAEQVHRYERLRIQHSTKVSYFAGIREIEPYRVDYNFPDDTPEYVEHFLDTAFIELDPTETEGLVFEPDGGVRSLASSAQITSKALRSYRNVRGLQFATQESDLIQVFEDPDFNAYNMLRWTAYGDAKVTRVGPGLVTVNRGWDPNTYGELEQAPYGKYETLEEHTYSALEGLGPTGQPEGGISSLPYLPFGSGEVMARVIVSAPADLTLPIAVELVSVETGTVLASSQRLLKAGETVTLSVKIAGSGKMVPRSWGDIEVMDTPPTQYEELEERTYAELESAEGQASSLYVRVVQHGESTDSFRVHRIALYDSPVAWFFSNDDGGSYWQAVSVRNDPHAVLTFPDFFDTDDVEMGRTLRWRAKVYKAGATISALHIRPWYGVRGRTVDAAHGMEILGPNRNLRDQNPATHQHPMWQEIFNPVEHTYVAVPPTWRNLMPNPSAEGPTASSAWTPEGGTITPVLGATGSGLRSFEFTAEGGV